MEGLGEHSAWVRPCWLDLIPLNLNLLTDIKPPSIDTTGSSTAADIKFATLLISTLAVPLTPRGNRLWTTPYEVKRRGRSSVSIWTFGQHPIRGRVSG